MFHGLASCVTKLLEEVLTYLQVLWRMVFIHLLLPDPSVVPVPRLIPAEATNLAF